MLRADDEMTLTSKQSRAIAEAEEALRRNEVKFCLANGRVHFMIQHQSKRIDFWPTSGKWIVRGYRDVVGQGLSSLLLHMGFSEKEHRS